MKYFLFLAVLFGCVPLFASSDLELESLQAQPDPNGRVVQLKLYLSNQGPADANLLACNIYLLGSQKLLLSQTLSLNPLANQEKRVDSIQVDLPKATVTAVKVEIFDSQEPDFQPSSNSQQVSLKPTGNANADLQIVDAEIKTTQPVSENKVTLHVRLRNNGPDPAPNVGLKISLLIFNNPVLEQEKRIGRLDAAKEQEVDILFALNKTIASSDGVFEINLLVDPEKITDAVDYNNKISVPVQLTPRLPDLVIQEIKVNEKGNLAFFVQNKGNAPSSVSDTVLTINGALIQHYKTSNLSPNEIQRFVYSGGTLLPGSQVSVIADYNADNAEVSETNNKSNFTPDEVRKPSKPNSDQPQKH